MRDTVNSESTNLGTTSSDARRLWITVGVVVAGTLISLLLYGTLRWEERELARADFKLRSADRMKSITNEFENGLMLVRSITACMQSPADVTHARFRELTKHLLSEGSTLQAIGWNRRVSGRDLRDHIAAAKVRFPAYEVRQLRPDGTIATIDVRTEEVADSREFVVVDLIEPFEPNQSALGLDIASEPVRRQALDRACEEGQPIASGRIRLVQETGAQFGTLVVCPIYREAITTDVVTSPRKENVASFVVGVYRIGDTVEAALRNLEPTGINVYLFDELATPGEQLLYAHSSRMRTAPMEIIEDPKTLEACVFCESSAFDFAGRRWTLYCTPAASFLASRRTWLPVTVLGGGLLITLLIAGYVSNLSRLTHELQQQIVVRTEVETELRRARDELRVSEAKYRTIVDTTHEWIWEIDLHGVHTFSNSAIESILGYSVDEIMGQSSLALMHEEDQKMVRDKLPVLMGNADGWSGWSIRWRHKDGSIRYLESHAVPILDTQGQVVGYRGGDRDITARLKAEKQLQEHQHSLAHVSRLSTMGEMVAGIAHEVNQPLAAIANYAAACINVVKTLDCDSAALEKWLTQVSLQAVRCGDIIRRLRSFVNKGDQQRDYVDLNRVVRDSVALIGGDMRHQTSAIDCRLPNAGPQVYASEVQLQQVLVNLLRNACDATHDTAKPQIHVSMEVHDHRVCLAVEDNGPGVEEHQQGKLFDAFFTTRPEGMGMGLAISKSIIDAHQGNLWLDPESRAGAKFRIELPMQQRA